MGKLACADNDKPINESESKQAAVCADSSTDMSNSKTTNRRTENSGSPSFSKAPLMFSQGATGDPQKFLPWPKHCVIM